jgi:hypothetical protein
MSKKPQPKVKEEEVPVKPPPEIVRVEKFFALRKRTGGLYAVVVLSMAYSQEGETFLSQEEFPEDILDVSHEKASVEMLHQALAAEVTA